MQHFANMADPQTTKKGPSAIDMDTGQLFETYTIEEIRKIERETRAEIEKKKEDLRQMVGERYRDLIDAADTISDMKACTEKIVTAVQGMQGYCTKLQKTHMVKGVLASPRGTKTDRSSQNDFYAIASQTKLLMDMPEKIWSAIESSEHLIATELYLLACHIVSSLQLDSNTQQSAQLLAWFPVLSRQWAAISHFKAGILQSCRKLLKNGSVSDQATAEALCSIMLLEESSPRQVFTEFLLARKAAVQHCFHSSQQGMGVRGQICSVTELICVTVKQIYAVFYHQEDKKEEDHSNLLLKTLQEVTSEQHASKKKTGILQSEMVSASFTKHLPSSVIGFRPSPRTPSTAIAPSYLQQSLEQWVETCIQDVHSGVGKLLGHVTSMKALATIRDAVWDLLAEDNGEVSWSTVCQCVLDRQLSLWGEFIRPLFLTRVQAIIQDALDLTSTGTQRHTQQALSDLGSPTAEQDIAAYVWAEAPNDTPIPAAWKGGGGTLVKQAGEPGGLYMKARAFTPRTQGICTSLDSQLKALLEDMAYYTESPAPQPRLSSADKGTKKAEPFDRFADTVTLHSFLQISCTTCLQRLLGIVGKQLEETKSQLDTCVHLGQTEQSSRVVDRALLLGRLCSALVELCPNLQKAANIAEPETKPSKPEPQSWLRSKLMGKRSASKPETEEETEWDNLKGLLLQQSKDAYRVWSDFTASRVLADFGKYLTDPSSEAALKAATHWDTIEIQEESEEGKKVTSKVQLPVQASWYVQTVLYSLCEEINRVGGHALSRSILSGLIQETSSGILALYKKHLDEHRSQADRLALSQSQALQLLFDVRFVAAIMSGRGEDAKKNSTHKDNVQKLVDRLENTIDPFDLDVFLPHLQTNLSRHTQRCTMLLGALASPDKHMYSSHRAVPSGYQEQHNVLPLASSQGRFTLLPLSTTSSQSLQRSLPRPLPQPASPVALPQDPSSPPPVLHKSRTAPSSLYSKFGSLKTGWLANISGAQ
ncbi:conserved oligomeric Golgi complex subunit 1-like [Acanthaster planci]|uniref:Conserved oligomeric Golgi complex subunit 1 n=1 Tax=Acanthaster planci TaxID=133434 RepID=A0A8B7ZK05_ACAPL|nr:conserved oligomeric Golgi complex subunit 1-like [Acanthaster planci]